METKNVARTNSTAPISSSKVSQNQAAKKENSSVAKNAKSNPGVNVNLSSQAKGISEARAKALDIAKNTPDIRADKVAALKAQINNGSYKIDSGKIADGMFREAIVEKLSRDD